MLPDNQATFLHHTSCDACGSSDANGVYDDGHTFCFSCQTHKSNSEEDGREERPIQNQENTKQEGLLSGDPKAIAARGLTEEDCKKFSYWIGQDQYGQTVQIANYRDKYGKVIAQKIRGRDKTFKFIGDAKNVTLFGSHMWTAGKKVCIVEGEIDAISLSKCFGHKFAVVSLPNGAQSAVKAIKDNFEWLVGFEQVVVCTDMDEAGRDAAEAIAEVLPVGKVLIASLPAKDANDALVQGKTAELIDAIYQARAFRPDGIRAAGDYRDIIAVDDTASSITWPYSGLNSMLGGVRRRELICLASGSGVGKTTFCKEVVHHFMMQGEKVGMINLEEAPKRTLLGLVGVHLSKNLLVERDQATDQEVLDGFDDLFGDRTCMLYDSFGSTSPELICQRIQYMVRAHSISVIVLDHVTMLTASMVDERRELDKCVTKFRELVEENDITMIMVSHLTRPGGRGHEGGASVELSQLRSSHSLAQLSDAAIGIQKDPEDPDSDVRFVRVLKNRFSGSIGDASTLVYRRDSGRLIEEQLVPFLEDTQGETAHDE